MPPKSTFRVEINGYGPNSGNGNVMVNFFAGKKYDGEQKLIKITKETISNHVIEINTPDFPKNTTIYLRVWRPSDAVGAVGIRDITVTQIAKKSEPAKRRPRLPPPSTNVKPKKYQKQKRYQSHVACKCLELY